MSHALVVVMAGSQQQAESLLAPYNEQITVNPYKRPCFCINRIAEQKTTEYSEKLLGTPADAWRTLVANHPNMTQQELEQLWATTILPDRRKAEHDFFIHHPAHGQPDPSCPECHGTGIQEVTLNPIGKYDWYIQDSGWADWLLPLEPSQVGMTKDDATYSLPDSILTPSRGWHNSSKTWWGYESTITESEAEQTWSVEYWTIFEEAKAMGLLPFVFNYHS